MTTSNSLKHLASLEECHRSLISSQDIPITSLHKFLMDLTSATAKMGSTFEKASIDIEKKLSIITGNQQMFPSSLGLFSFISTEINQNIHKLNGKSGNKVPYQLTGYTSTARTTMRLLWFLEFIEYILQRALDHKYKSHLQLVEEAYSKTLGKHHGWLTRNIAKLTIGNATTNPYFLIQGIAGTTNIKVFKEVVDKMIGYLKPIIEKSWSFYHGCGITLIQ